MKRLIISISFMIGVVPIVAVVLFFIINLPNPDLEPGAARLIAQAKVKYPIPRNAYYPLIGFRLTGPGTPAERGRAYADRVESLSGDARDAYSDRVFKAVTSLPNIVPCEPDKRACLPYFRANRAKISQQMGPYRSLLAAYRKIVQSYHEFYESDNNLDWLTGMGKVHRVVLFQMSQRWRPGHRHQVLLSLDRDMAFWRTILGNARTMLTKVYAAKMLREDYALTGDFIDTCRRCPTASDVREVVKPLTARELDLGPALDSSFLVGVRVIKKHYKARATQRSSLLGHLAHVNAIINALYDMTQDEIRVSRADDQSLARVARSVARKYSSDHAGWWFGLFVHPAAKVFASIARVNVMGHVKRVRAVEHLRERDYAKLKLQP